MTRAITVVFLTPIAVVVLGFAATQVVGSPQRATTTTASAHGFVWGDRVFTTPRALRRWLESRGIAYRPWLTKHPAAARWSRSGLASGHGRSAASGGGIIKSIFLISFCGLLAVLAWERRNPFGRKIVRGWSTAAPAMTGAARNAFVTAARNPNTTAAYLAVAVASILIGMLVQLVLT